MQDLRESRLIARSILESRGQLAFKPVTSAKWVNIKRSWSGLLHVQVEHDTVHGCTPAMFKWWFENQARTTTWDGIGFNGPLVSFYHLWHHRDHVAVTPLTGSEVGFIEGGYTRVTEQFNDFHEMINVDSVTDRLDETEFTFSVRILGMVVCRIIHFYEPEKDGSRFFAETVVGSEIPVIGWLFNWLIAPFIYSKTTGENWIRHNIEETGRSESIIPPLYDHYVTKAEKKQS